jgi:hypothetical protein
VARSVAFIVSRFGRLQRAGRLLRRQTVRDDRDSVTNRLAGLLAETYHEILGEGTLEAALERIADTISRLIPVDGVSVVSELNGTKDLLFERGSLARDAGDVCQIEIGMVTRGRQKGVLTVWRDSRRKPFDDDDVRLIRWFADAAAGGGGGGRRRPPRGRDQPFSRGSWFGSRL